MDSNNPLGAIYAYAEQAYIRMQAGDLLMRCLDTGSSQPMQELVEGLVLAGPESIGALYEIMLETGQRRTQVQDDLQRLFGDFQNKIRKQGVKISEILPDANSLLRLNRRRFHRILSQQGISTGDRQEECAQIYDETQEMMHSLAENIALLLDIENYLKDWLWGLAYQSAHEARHSPRKSTGDLLL
jgi:hypothetical protein